MMVQTSKTPPPTRRLRQLAAGVLAVLLAGCGGRTPTPADLRVDRLFTRIPPAYSGITFENRLKDTPQFNVITYRNYYDGGGVGVADLNGDGLPEVFLTANQLPNRLYLNEGGFRFRDVTDRAGVAGRHRWSTGVAVADVNGDGWLDLYVCISGDGDDRANELLINQGPDADGVPRFREEAEQYGLADTGYGTHAAFFDYDRDGDLDLYLLNNTSRAISSFSRELDNREVPRLRRLHHPAGGDKLYRNDDGRFTDATAEAGIYGGEFGFGLSVTVGDVDRDGWPDVYVANDFFERDFLYLNNHDGTFTDRVKEQMPVISQSSMGADLADLNGDGYPELYVTDMLPEDEIRLKTTSTFDTWAAYQNGLRNDLHHQFMRNMLHRNNGNGTFSEVGQIAGVASTDWSWSTLLADLDLDGFKDIFVSNGIARDLTNQDFIAFFEDEETVKRWLMENDFDFSKLIDELPSTPLPNYAFRNDGNPGQGLSFTNEADAWGLGTPGFSNGAAYGDLDGDGDLDLVVNNVDAAAFVYRNEADTLTQHHYLQVRLDGEAPNPFGVGAQVTLYAGGRMQYQELMPTRGFQSSVDYVLAFGLGAATRVDSLRILWPDGRVQRLTDVPADQRLAVRPPPEAPRGAPPAQTPPPATPLHDVTAAAGLDYVHRENDFVDFNRGERLLPRMLSTEGPRLAVADVDGDGRDDLYLGGAKGSPGRLYLQRPDGGFTRAGAPVFEQDAVAEDLDAAFFDADGDGDPDLFVVSGGSEFSAMAPGLEDRLYLNDGRGGFEKSRDRLPRRYVSGGAVAAADYDGDGDVDLFVGGRLVPWRYGLVPESALLLNDGRGVFTDATAALAPGLADVGMVTDAAWADADGDGRLDLAVVGEWMPITLFRNAGGGTLERPASPNGLERSHGLWNRLLADDLDGDGDVDFVAGNLGRNSKLYASEAEPLTMHVHDFDRNGFEEQILSISKGGTAYPMVLRRDLVEQLPFMAERFPTHAAFAGQAVTDLFSVEELREALVYEAYTLNTSYIENRGDGTFRVSPLPYEAQLAPVYGLLAGDYDGDGRRDLLLGGNFHAARPEIGRLFASYGLLLRGDGAGGFEPVPVQESGFLVPGAVRDMQGVTVRGEARVFVAKNDAGVQVFAF